MGQAKRAWIYCRIDAPEDLHGALKRQRQQLMDYAEQMGCEVVGSSQDTGASKQSLASCIIYLLNGWGLGRSCACDELERGHAEWIFKARNTRGKL